MYVMRIPGPMEIPCVAGLASDCVDLAAENERQQKLLKAY